MNTLMHGSDGLQLAFDGNQHDESLCAYPGECGVCVGGQSGPGAIYECGCFDRP